MYRCNDCSLQLDQHPWVNVYMLWYNMNLLQHTSGPFAIGALCTSFLNHPALLQWHVITSGQVPRWYKSPLQHTSEQMSIPGPVPTIQESFAAHFWTGVHMVHGTRWASAHITRILCSSLACEPVSIWWHTMGQCPHYKNPLQLIFGLVHGTSVPCSAQMIQENFAIHFWASVQVSYVSWCPAAKQVLCSTLLGWCPSVI